MDFAIPLFVQYLVCGALIVALGMVLQFWVTPFSELKLVAAGNTAAAWVLAGHLLGITLPVASAMAHSVSLPDMFAWGAAATLIQVLSHMGARGLLPGFVRHIEEDRPGVGVASAALCVSVGILNAAALTY